MINPNKRYSPGTLLTTTKYAEEAGYLPGGYLVLDIKHDDHGAGLWYVFLNPTGKVVQGFISSCVFGKLLTEPEDCEENE